MSFEPLVSWNGTLAISIGLVMIFLIQTWAMLTGDISSKRKRIKITLNAFLITVLMLFSWNPVWESQIMQSAALLVNSSDSPEKIDFWEDSLDLKSISDLDQIQENQTQVYLLGQEFSKEELLQIQDRDLQWIPDFKNGQFTFLEWKGMLHLGESQILRGRIESPKIDSLTLSFGGESIAEAAIDLSSGEFELRFPVMIQGRNELDFFHGDSLLGKVNFFTLPSSPVNYELRFSFPNPESRTLGSFLARKGDRVAESVQLSKDTRLSSGSQNQDSLQVMILDAGQLSGSSFQSQLDSGMSFLVMNLGDPDQGVSQVNRVFGTDFQISRISSEESRLIEGKLEAAPFEFQSKENQSELLGNSVAFQRIGNSKVGVSLLEQTFPIQLSGDSVAYEEIWDEILKELRPDEPQNISFQAPAYSGEVNSFLINRKGASPEQMLVGSDTIYLQQSPINALLKSGEMLLQDSGWIALDGGEMEFYLYSSGDWQGLNQLKFLSGFMQGRPQISERDRKEILVKRALPDYVWLTLILATFTVVWLEPKVRL